ncbi:MAG: hypothetical protein OXU68_02505 [Bacteroidota bacterium]|nr:hypothetical protein [Bacteroidota bacterium]
MDVVDNSARKVQFFAMDGSYLRSESTSYFPVRYNVTGGGRVYAMTAQFEYLFKSRMGDDIVAFKSVPQDPNGMPGDGMLLGHLAVNKESLVYPPINFPVIVQYTPSRAVAYARSTPD